MIARHKCKAMNDLESRAECEQPCAQTGGRVCIVMRVLLWIVSHAYTSGLCQSNTDSFTLYF